MPLDARFHRALTSLALLALGGCDVPTGLPSWETDWEAVVLSDTISTAGLLPDDVSLSSEGFVLERYETQDQVRLSDVCPLCTCFDGPVPPLELEPWDWPFRLPGGLRSAEVLRGTVDLVLHNEVGFDILKAGNETGYLQVELADRWTGEVLESLRIERPFPPGDSLVLSMDLPAVHLSDQIVARIRGETPGSGECDVDLGPESGFRTRAVLRDVVAASVEVSVADTDLALPSREWDLPDWLLDRLRPGDAEAVLDVRVGTAFPASVEVELSAAATPALLFGGGAALFTPLVLPSGRPEPVDVRREYLVDLEALQGADRLFVAGRTRILGDRVVTLRGDESLTYSIVLRAELPTR